VAAVIVLGGSGFVGSRVLELWSNHVELIAPSHAELDVLDGQALVRFLEATQASAVVNLVAWADVDGAEAQRGDHNGLAYRLNSELPRRLAHLCAEHGRHLLHVSTDYVFDGTNAERPYREDDPTGPLCWYAESKLAGEHAVRDANERATVARIEMPFGARPHRKRDFARTFLERLKSRMSLKAVVDQRITPIFVDDAADALRHLLTQRVPGVVHVSAADASTPYDIARSIAVRLGFDQNLVEPTRFEDFARTRPARRPQHSWLDVTRFSATVRSGLLRTVDAELDAWAAQLLALVS
jgi:dTDP-4-dehydrorhamnose reductase